MSDVGVFEENSTGAKNKAVKVKFDESVELIFIMQLSGCIARIKKNSSVTKREETTRSHPEHGRKDS